MLREKAAIREGRMAAVGGGGRNYFTVRKTGWVKVAAFKVSVALAMTW